MSLLTFWLGYGKIRETKQKRGEKMNPKREDLKRVYAYRYKNGMVIVYGQDEHNNDIHRAFLFYDSLADIKRELKSRGVKNVSHMKKWVWG